MAYNYKSVCPDCNMAIYPRTGIIQHGKKQHNKGWTLDYVESFLAQCNICKESMPQLDLKSHLRSKHDLPIFSATTKGRAASDSPLDSIRAAERQIISAIRDLESERDQLHAKIVEIDNLITKYKKFNGNS